MTRATARYKTEIRKSHTVISYVDVISPTNESVRLPAIDGEVSVDRTAAVRRACRIKCIDPHGTLVPVGTDSILTPYGTEVRPYRGIVYSDGAVEVYPLGVFRISKVTVTDSLGGSPSIDLEAYDLSRTVARDKFTVPYIITVGTNLLSAIKSILGRTFAGLEYDAMSTSIVTTAPQVYDAGDDPWVAASDLAQSMGCDLYFDVDGRVVVAPPVDINALPSPDFDYIEGQGCTMLQLGQQYSDEPGFNGVIVLGESLGDELPPVRSEAWDVEPSSATYHLGPYGEVPLFVKDQNVKTQADADAMSQQLLRNLLGFSSQLSITATVNATFEAGDVVQVTRSRSHVSGLYALDAFNVPLRKESTQSLTVRQKRIVS